MKVLLICLALILAGSGVSSADIPPPSRIPETTAAALRKGPTIRLAAYPDFMPYTKREFQQGDAFDTRAYCSATIDIGADPGVTATIAILGDDDPMNKYEEFPLEASITLTGKEKPDRDHVVRISRVIPLRHNQTDFIINLTGASVRSHQNLFVNMVPLPCGATVQ